VLKVLREFYGVGILFFYYMKYIILLGWPILLYGLEYKPNIIMDVLWVYCFVLMVKDYILKYVFKKKYCTLDTCSSPKKK